MHMCLLDRSLGRRDLGSGDVAEKEAEAREQRIQPGSCGSAVVGLWLTLRSMDGAITSIAKEVSLAE